MTAHFQNLPTLVSLGFELNPQHCTGDSECRGGEDVQSVLSGSLKGVDEDMSRRQEGRALEVRSPLSKLNSV